MWKRVKRVAGSTEAADLASLSAATQAPTVQWLVDTITAHHACRKLVKRAVPLFFSLLFAAVDKRPFVLEVPALSAIFQANVECIRVIRKCLEPIMFVATRADCYSVLLPLLVRASDVILFQHQYDREKLRTRSISRCLFLSTMVTFHAVNGNQELTVMPFGPLPDDDPVEVYAVSTPRPMEELLALVEGEAMGRMGEAMGRMVANLVLEVGLRL